MSIQEGQGLIRIDPNDPQFTFRNITIAIKIRKLMWPVIVGCIKNSDGSWEAKEDLTGGMFESDVIDHPDVVKYWSEYHGGPKGFVNNIVLYRLNDWLSKVFPASDTPVTDHLELIFNELSSIKFTSHAYGTVTASI